MPQCTCDLVGAVHLILRLRFSENKSLLKGYFTITPSVHLVSSFLEQLGQVDTKISFVFSSLFLGYI